jgi:hypothetical protein
LLLINRIEQVLAMEVGVLSGCDLSLFPDKGSFSLKRPEAELDQLGLPIICDESESVYTPAIHVPV